MKIGDKGENIKELQDFLTKQGFYCVSDGEFGKKTQSALKAFQKKNGLVETGEIGPLSMEYFNKPKPNPERVLDSRTQKNLDTLDPKAKKIFLPFILEAKEVAKALGYDYVAISGTRGEQEQNDLYAQGRTKPGKIVTNAKYGYSNHNWGCSLDFGIFKDGKYLDDINPGIAEKVHLAVAKIADKYEIDWGGNWKKFKDTPHFEIKSNLTMAEKRDIFKKNGSIL